MVFKGGLEGDSEGGEKYFASPCEKPSFAAGPWQGHPALEKKFIQVPPDQADSETITHPMLQCDRATNGAEITHDSLESFQAALLQCDRATNGAEIVLATRAEAQDLRLQCDRATNGAEMEKAVAEREAMNALQCDRATNGAEIARTIAGAGCRNRASM